MEKQSKKTRAHTRYMYNGKRVPGVTTIVGVINKPALVQWANKMGLQGIDVRNYVDEKADIGTCAHYMIECDFKGIEPDLSLYSEFVIEQAINSYRKYLEWRKDQMIKPILIEDPLVCADYGGTIDAYLELNGRRVLVDIKTCKCIYGEHKIQVGGGYVNLLMVNEYPVDDVIILRVGRDSGEGFEVHNLYNGVHVYNRAFRCALGLYRALKDV